MSNDETEDEIIIPGLLSEYFKLNFDKIDKANSNFCRTVEEHRLSKYLAKRLNISKRRLETILRKLQDES